MIPKSDGKERPLAISCLEDKIVQKMTKDLLDAIYEPVFLNCSYGFRTGRSCHDAIRDLDATLYKRRLWHVLDIDLQNYFGEISHEKLIAILGMKISDKRFLRYISRMLKSGVLSDGRISLSQSGSPQGSICSPVLANVYAHYCIDTWFETEVKPKLQGTGYIVRYADDICICLTSEQDIERVMKSLRGRLARFELKLNEGKTSVIKLDKREGASKGSTLKFLGFEMYVGKTRDGRPTIKIKTSGASLSNALRNITEWVKKYRCTMKISQLWKAYLSKVRGHLIYFGVSGNFRWLQKFSFSAKRIFFKWINRRSQKKSLNWEQFNLFLKVFPMPLPQIIHRLY